MHDKDPIGRAIIDFSNKHSDENIIVESNLCDDDVIPVKHLFRTFDEMPLLEKKALELCRGKILDIGAAAGCHAQFLRTKEYDVFAIDTSKGAIEFLLSKNISAECIALDNFYPKEKFDTALCLMNGVGIAGKLDQLEKFLIKLKSLILPEGKILCDSTDISYLFEEEDGSIWVNLDTLYHGEMQFNMKYKDVESGWFPWLYVDFEKLNNTANQVGLSCKLIYEDENNSYLAELCHK